jgi:predicted DNA-binding WGR domain protein
MSLDRIVTWGDNLAMYLPEVTPVNLIHIDLARNMARFYGIEVQPTLFGEVSVLRNWGRIGTKGRGMMVTYGDEDQAATALQKLDKQKRRRGYVEMTT